MVMKFFHWDCPLPSPNQDHQKLPRTQKRQQLAISIKTTGQIETLPGNQVEVTTPISGAKVVELLVEPEALEHRGQPVAPDAQVTAQIQMTDGQEKTIPFTYEDRFLAIIIASAMLRVSGAFALAIRSTALCP
ncbi:MAG: hypothetical protein KME59_11350 [Trichormus sp. ATA11-4-KO1]|jgi:hypothetical protein|nr:hypothetical protein [Trichormus sp. ATA11-4-KO1]